MNQVGRRIALALALFLSGCASFPPTWNSSPKGNDEASSGYTYVPLDPLTVEYDACKPKTNILDYLPDNAVRISIKDLKAGVNSEIGRVGIGTAGEQYRVVLDYVNVDNTNIPFELAIKKKGKIPTAWDIRYNIRRVIAGDSYSPPDIVLAPKFMSKVIGFPGIVIPWRNLKVPDEGKVIFVVPVYVGVGLRLTAEIRVLNGKVNLSSLPGIAASVEAGNASGSLVVQTLGITGRQVSGGLIFTSDLNETTVQNAILSLGKIKSLLYSNDAIIRPRVTGMYLPIRDAQDHVVNAIVSELARKPIIWKPGC